MEAKTIKTEQEILAELGYLRYFLAVDFLSEWLRKHGPKLTAKQVEVLRDASQDVQLSQVTGDGAAIQRRTSGK